MRRSAVPLVLTGLLLTATACSSGSSDSSTSTTARAGAPTVAVEGSVLIDVRTPQEFASGHLDGAVNIDVQSADFTTQIGALDPAGRYLVYCRSGNRSAVAIDLMRSAGFTDLTDLGGVAEAAAATGLPVS